MKVECKIAGVVQCVEAVREDGTTRHLAGPFRNLITDAGLDMIGLGGRRYPTYYTQRLHLGTGTTEPQPSDTQLENRIMIVGSPSGATGNITDPPYGAWAQLEWLSPVFTEAAILGELGVSSLVSEELFARALLKDTDGEPTTVEVLAGERVRARYRLSVYAPEVDRAGTAEFDFEGIPTEVAWVSRARNANAWILNTASNQTPGDSFLLFPIDSVLGPVTGSPTGSSISATGQPVRVGEYVPGTYTINLRATFGPTAGNVEGGAIGAAVISANAQQYQMSFDPPIPKDANKTTVINVSIGWGRADDA